MNSGAPDSSSRETLASIPVACRYSARAPLAKCSRQARECAAAQREGAPRETRAKPAGVPQHSAGAPLAKHSRRAAGAPSAPPGRHEGVPCYIPALRREMARRESP